ncbi:type III-B CRISPR module-associated protein Cmr5 [Thauera sp.]|uniref:type III-B CRISPR module-associated protein Cmr5 n=1 Tax=Thauera sp. TaxID=1905334 RepID=UPI001B45F85B|nr:type III-B CRISPR module-associated protein Cmr5 [Thauera sp.]MBP6130131.1 type III-B CRISPR module-associated protein Cmr5 [Thauera sp.]MBP7048019.1 type III-B CRISPR module-associated protein Cmr5 [Thauera sp.]
MNTTAKTAPVTLEQQRAQFAWDCAKEGTALAGDDYRNLAKAAPALIMNNGLMQTLAFYQDKGKPHHMTLAGQLRRWIMKREGGNGQDPGFPLMMEALLRAQPDQYRRATDESLLILRWIRQFAAAL